MQNAFFSPSRKKDTYSPLKSIHNKENAFNSFRSGKNDNLADEYMNFEYSGPLTNRSLKGNPECSSASKKFQSGPRDLTDYIFADNNSSIYYTENFEERSNAQYDSRSSKIDPCTESKEYMTSHRKSVSSSYVSEPRSLYENSTAKKYKTEENEIAEDRSIFVSDKETILNGVIADPDLFYEGKPFIVMSVQNDIYKTNKNSQELSHNFSPYTANTSFASVSRRKEDSFFTNQCQEEIKKAEAQILGLRGFKTEVSDFISSLETQNISQRKNAPPQLTKQPPSTRFREETLKSYEEEDQNTDTDLFKRKSHMSIGKAQQQDQIYQQKRQELEEMNQKLLDAGSELEKILDFPDQEDQHQNPLVKKTLSVIYSTNESIDTSSQIHKHSRNNTESDVPENYNPRQDSVSSSNVLPSERENFMSLLHMIKYKYKDNKDLSENLYKLMDLHNKEVHQYEENIKQEIEKTKKYAHTNELLIKTLKTFEQELDKLAINNQTLHQNILYLQDQIKTLESKEKNHKELVHQQDRAFNLLKEELRIKVDELEDTKNKLSFANSKVESLGSYAQSCEDSISFVSQTLKQSLSSGGGKVTAKQVYSVLETIYAGISKFQEKGNIKIKIDDSFSCLGSRKNSDFSRFEEPSSFLTTGNINLSSRRDTNSSTGTFMEPKISKALSKSIDLSTTTRKYSLNPHNTSSVLSNRQRQYSLIDTSYSYANKDDLKNSRGRSTSRNKSVEKVSLQRFDKSAPLRKSHTPTQSKRQSKNILEAEIEDSFRKRLMDNLKHK